MTHKRSNPEYGQPDQSAEWQAMPKADKAKGGISNAVAADGRHRKVPKEAIPS